VLFGPHVARFVAVPYDVLAAEVRAFEPVGAGGPVTVPVPGPQRGVRRVDAGDGVVHVVVVEDRGEPAQQGHRRAGVGQLWVLYGDRPADQVQFRPAQRVRMPVR
jgi:hypothetical protein